VSSEIRLVKRDQLKATVASGEMSRTMAISDETVGSENIYTAVSRIPPGLRSTPHVHTNCESSLYVASGQGRMLTGPRLDRAMQVEPGDFLYVPPGAPHTVVNDGDVDLVLIVSRNTKHEAVEEFSPDRQPTALSAGAAPFSRPILLDRCKTCRVPIRGPRAVISRLRGIVPYSKNPQLCNRCEKRIHGSEDSVVTVLFADIRGYSSRTEHSSNDELLKMLRDFFNTAAPAVYDHYGVVDQFLGDGMKVLFNVPGPRISHAEDAVRAALAICEGLRSAPFSVGVGVETGMALVGHIGLSGVVDFTCVGEAVNHAARLQALAGPGEVLLGPNVWRKTSSLVEGRGVIVTAETLDLKGIGSLEVHRLAARATATA
jgi:class 3 adenylate cyclase/uncharacterized RmlC-like cupin family protein